MKSRYSKEELEKIVKISSSMGEVILAFGKKYSGGTFNHFKKIISHYEIDISHFTGQGWSKGKKSNTRLEPKDYLVYDTTVNRNSHNVKMFILRDGVKPHKCEVCENETWLRQPIPLELHHVNGDRFDNRIENLLLLCPNCHSQTENYAGKANKTSA